MVSDQDSLDVIKYLGSKFPLFPLEGFSSYVSNSKIVTEQLETIEDNPDYPICSFIFYVHRYLSCGSELKQAQAKAKINVDPLASNFFKNAIKEINDIYFNSVQTKLTSIRKVFSEEILKLLPDEGDFAIFKLVMRIDQYARNPDVKLLDQISSFFNIDVNINSERIIKLLKDVPILNCILFALMMSNNKEYWESKWVQTLKDINPQYRTCFLVLQSYYFDDYCPYSDNIHKYIPKNSIVTHFVGFIYLRQLFFSQNEKASTRFYDQLNEMGLMLYDNIHPLAILTHLGLIAIKFTQCASVRAIIIRIFESFIESFTSQYLTANNASALKQLLENKIIMQILSEVIAYDFSIMQCVLSPAPLDMCVSHYYAMRFYANENQNRVNELFWAQLDNIDLHINNGPKRRFEDRPYKKEEVINFYAAMYQLLFHMGKQYHNSSEQLRAIQKRIDVIKSKIPSATIQDEEDQWLVYSVNNEKILVFSNPVHKMQGITLPVEEPKLSLNQVDKGERVNCVVPIQVISKPEQFNRSSLSIIETKDQPDSYRKIHTIITRSEKSELPSYVIDESVTLSRSKLDDTVNRIACLLEKNLTDTKCYAVGGAVEDLSSGKKPRDYDVLVVGSSLETLFARLPKLVEESGIRKVAVFFKIIGTKHPILRLVFKQGPSIDFTSIIPKVNENIMDSLWRDFLERDFNLKALYFRLGDDDLNIPIFSFNGALTKRNQGILSTVNEISSATFISNPLSLFRLTDIKIRYPEYRPDDSLQKAIKDLAPKWLDIFDNYLKEHEGNQRRLTDAIRKLFERYNFDEINCAFDQLGILELFTKHSYETIPKTFSQNSLDLGIKDPLLNWTLSISQISSCKIPLASYLHWNDKQVECLKRFIYPSIVNNSLNKIREMDSIEPIKQVPEMQLSFGMK